MRNLSVEWKWCYWLIWKVTLALWHGVVFQPCWMMAKILNLNIRDSESACCRGVLAVLVARCDAHAPQQQRQEPGSHRPGQHRQVTIIRVRSQHSTLSTPDNPTMKSNILIEIFLLLVKCTLSLLSLSYCFNSITDSPVHSCQLRWKNSHFCWIVWNPLILISVCIVKLNCG